VGHYKHNSAFLVNEDQKWTSLEKPDACGNWARGNEWTARNQLEPARRPQPTKRATLRQLKDSNPQALEAKHETQLRQPQRQEGKLGEFCV
jgi:hypothetical protein